MKNTLKLVFYKCLCLFHSYSFILQIDFNFTVLSEEDIITPNPVSIKLNSKLYFVSGDKLRSEDRVIEFTNEQFEVGIAEELVKA